VPLRPQPVRASPIVAGCRRRPGQPSQDGERIVKRLFFLAHCHRKFSTNIKSLRNVMNGDNAEVIER
jgi:hypothetical protein